MASGPITIGSCGCWIEVSEGAGWAEFFYCPKHAAADAMYVALENALAELTRGTSLSRLRAMELLGNVLALADGDKDGE